MRTPRRPPRTLTRQLTIAGVVFGLLEVVVFALLIGAVRSADRANSREAERMKDEFSALVSHELRTPPPASPKPTASAGATRASTPSSTSRSHPPSSSSAWARSSSTGRPRISP